MTTMRSARSCVAPRPRGRRPRYAREIAIVLVVKALALTAIWQLWFAPPARPHVDAAAVASRIYSVDAAPGREGHARP
ncbi:MAG: cytochrome oxidase putative small subunit CydP [Betaproteobacteria bacterium]